MKVYQNTHEKIVKNFSLRFHCKKYEDDYSQKFSKEKKKVNLVMGASFFIVSIGLLLWTILIRIQVEEIIKERNIDLVQINKDNNISINSSARNSTESISNSTFLGNIYFFEKYFLVNKTAIQGSPHYYLPNSNQKNLEIARKILFVWRCLPLSGFSSFIHLILAILAKCVKNEKFQTVIYLLIFGLFGVNFHTASGIVRSFYLQPSDFIFFIVASQLFVKILVIMVGRIWWISMLITCSITILLEWTLFLSLHLYNHQPIIFYFLVSTLIHIASVLLSYFSELRAKKEFYFFRKMQFDNEYLINFIYNMDQGFVTMDNKEVLFINKSMNKIIEGYEKLNKQCKRRGHLETNHASIFHCPTNFLPHVECEVNPVHHLRRESLINDTVFVNLNQVNEETQNCREFLLNKNYTSHVKNSTKPTIERIIENLTEINPNLPEEILLLFKLKSNSENLSIATNSFSINDLYDTLKKNKDKFRDTNFTQLGIISLRKKCKTHEEDEVHPGVCQNGHGIPNVLNKTYQVMFRIIRHENENDYVELIFSDVSSLVHNEREKAIVNCRSIYLSKISHEFKNPIISLMELATGISEEAMNVVNSPQKKSLSVKSVKSAKREDKILQMTDYMIYICKTMNLFLKDFSLITQIKIPCEKCNSFSSCSSCSGESLCTVCKICITCERQYDHIIDHKKILVDFCETFNTLARHEEKNITLHLEYDMTENIKTNSDLFYSVMYNLIYHSYKNTDKGEIFIKAGRDPRPPSGGSSTLLERIGSRTSGDSVTFELKDSGLEIDQTFSKKLNQKLIIEDDSFYAEENCDKFNKYFNVYVAFCLVKKLGSILKIESNPSGTVYSFSLPTTSTLPDFIRDKDKESTLKNTCVISDLALTTKISFKPNFSSLLKRKISFSNSDKTIIFEDPIEFNYNKVAFETSRDAANITKSKLHISPEHKEQDISSRSSLSVSVDEINVNFDLMLNPCFHPDKKRVLLVDDESLIRSTLKRFLHKIDETNNHFSLETHEASNCFTALDLIYRKYEEDNIQFDYIIIDEYMPHMKGSTLIKLLKQLHHENNFYNMTFISHTAFDTPEKKKFIIEHGADFILSKPMQYNDFKEFFEGLIHEKKKGEGAGKFN